MAMDAAAAATLLLSVQVPFLLLVVYVDASPAINQVSNCTGHQVTLTCGPKTLIHVKDMVYGQASPDQCSFDPDRCYELDKEFHPCTGAQTCRLRVQRRGLGSCGWSSYMTLTYHCVPVTSVNNICGKKKRQALQPATGYLSTPGYPHMLSLPASLHCSLTIAQPKNHLIKIYILDYGKVKGTKEGGCESQVTFEEQRQRQKHLPQVSLCLDSDLTRNQLLYKSLSNSVQVSFTGPQQRASGESSKIGVLIYYKAVQSNVEKTGEPTEPPQPVTTRKLATTTLKQLDKGTTGPSAPMDFFLRPIPDIAEEAFDPKHVNGQQTTTPSEVKLTKMSITRPGINWTNFSAFNIPLFDNDDWWQEESRNTLLFTSTPNLTAPSTHASKRNSTNQIASTMGGVLFGLALILLTAIIIILYLDKKRAASRKERTKREEEGFHGRGLHSWLRNSCLSYPSSSDEASTDSTGASEREHSNIGYHHEALDDCQIPQEARRDHEVYTIDLDKTIIHAKSPPTPARRTSYGTTVTIEDGDVTIHGSMEYLPPLHQPPELNHAVIYEEPCPATISGSEGSPSTSAVFNLNSSHPSVYDHGIRKKHQQSRCHNAAVPRPMQPPPPKPKTQKPPIKPKPRLTSSHSSLIRSSLSLREDDLDSNGYVPCRSSQSLDVPPLTQRNMRHQYSNHKLKKERRNSRQREMTEQ